MLDEARATTDHHDHDRRPAIRRPPRRSRRSPPVAEGEADRPDPDPGDRRRLDRRRGRGARRPQEGPGPLPGDAAARPGRQRRHRRPPHHLRRAVPPLDELEPGDEIIVTTVQGEFTYEVTETAHRLAHPGRGARGQGRQPAHPHGLPPEVQRPRSASSWWRSWPRTRSRSPPPPTARTRRRRRRSTTSTARARRRWPAILLGLVCAPIWLVAWLVGRRWRKWPSLPLGLPFFMVTLFFFFEKFSRLLPSNY